MQSVRSFGWRAAPRSRPRATAWLLASFSGDGGPTTSAPLRQPVQKMRYSPPHRDEPHRNRRLEIDRPDARDEMSRERARTMRSGAGLVNARGPFNRSIRAVSLLAIGTLVAAACTTSGGRPSSAEPRTQPSTTPLAG